MQQINRKSLDPLEREELRKLRHVITAKNQKANQANDIKITARWKGPMTDALIAVPLHEIPPPDSWLRNDVAVMLQIVQRHAQERCEQMGYKAVESVYFDGKRWQAKFKL